MPKFHFLIINTQPKTVIRLQDTMYSVGRDHTNEIVLPSSTISRHHARILCQHISEIEDYHYEVIDGNADGKPSHNGIFVNQKRSHSHRLKSGDNISFGGTIEALYFVAPQDLSAEDLSQLVAFDGPSGLRVEVKADERTTIML